MDKFLTKQLPNFEKCVNDWIKQNNRAFVNKDQLLSPVNRSQEFEN